MMTPYAQVFKAQWNGAEAAVKILHDQGEKQKAEFLHEASILKGLRHPNVVDYFGLAFSEKDEVRRKRLPSPTGSIHRAKLLQGSNMVPSVTAAPLVLQAHNEPKQVM